MTIAEWKMGLGFVEQGEAGCLMAPDSRRPGRTTCWHYIHGDATMAEDYGKDYGKMSRDALLRANEISERAIFWGLVFTVVIVVVAMVKGITTFG